MKLKRLSLQGYKTFASKTVFEFNEGITAVVGPNGSGKSNIADALRWVLGEQSYSALRGKRTTDMIFAGSQQKSRAGMAQAILTLDNTDNWLPIDFTEIEIGRRAYRSGENEYLLNGQKVRLRDVIDLLSTSGLAQHTYTIIGQGLVDQALSLRADERRILFEEAAGVSQYKYRRAETLRRLQETDRNLERVSDIVSEIQPRLQSLRRQANRAKNYDQVAADLRYHLRIWYGYRWDHSKHDLTLARKNNEKAQAAWQKGRNKLVAIQEKLELKRKETHKSQLLIRENEQKRDELRVLIENLSRDVAVLTERRNSIERQIADLVEDIPQLQAQQSKAREELDEAIVDLNEARADLKQSQEAIELFRLNTEENQTEIKDQTYLVDKLKQQQTRIQSELAQIEGMIGLLQNQVAIQEKNQLNDRELENVDQLVAKGQVKAQKAYEQLNSLTQELINLKQQRDQLSQERTQLEDNLRQSEDVVRRISDKLVSLETRLDLLTQLQKEITIDSAGISLVGRFLDLIKIPGSYRLPISAALANRIGTLVVPDSQALHDLIARAENTRVVLANLKAVNAPMLMPLPSEKDVEGWASELVESDPEVAELTRLLLGQVLVVKDNEAAENHARLLPMGTLAVSLDGYIAYPGGLVEINRASVADSWLSQQGEIDEIQLQLQNINLEQNKAITQYENVKAHLTKNQASLENIDRQLAILTDNERIVHNEYNELKRAHELASQEKLFLTSKMTSQQEELHKVQERLGILQSDRTIRDKELSEINLTLERAQTTLKALPIADIANEMAQLKQRVSSAQTILAGRQAVVDSRRATLNQIDDLLKRRLDRLDELQSRLKSLDLSSEQLELDKTRSAMDRIDDMLLPLQNQLADSEQALLSLENELARYQRQSLEEENNYTQARIDLNQFENRIDNLRERIMADLGLVELVYDDQPSQSPLPISEVVEQLPKVDELPDDVEEIIQDLRGQLTRMGAINPNAPAEYDETLERFEFLTQQIEDLTSTKKRLAKVIEDLDELTSIAFAETVKQVDTEFGQIFKRLFGGGSAQLVLTDPEDLTITGVDIVARLPRRREQGLALLSGGERSLTAAALIFALLKVSPTPFCVLDEMDAMLDEANVTRFRELLKELSQNTQFILITHNRGTVQAAKTIYGVSMGSDSVSQVISIRPEDYLSHKKPN